MIRSSARRKIGDILSDLGKYVLTAVPVAYFLSSYHDFTIEVMLYVAIVGVFLCFAGIYVINSADKLEEHMQRVKGKKHRVRLIKNAVISIETLND